MKEQDFQTFLRSIRPADPRPRWTLPPGGRPELAKPPGSLGALGGCLHPAGKGLTRPG